ncbi:hypothetical protein [Porphyromonas gulae]|uniref:hypothetical protein n=1 Tax=Porphyromonas gulae TaxID=111105 RepID=UPI00137719F2|nr:hypothetical protein [Porphyromonas gulae]
MSSATQPPLFGCRQRGRFGFGAFLPAVLTATDRHPVTPARHCCRRYRILRHLVRTVRRGIWGNSPDSPAVEVVFFFLPRYSTSVTMSPFLPRQYHLRSAGWRMRVPP